MKTSVTKAIIATAPLVLVLALSLPSAAIAGDRPGDAALGALSGAVVLGPIGAVAGAVVGYSAGPSIAHSLGFRRSSAARRRSPQQARASTGNREYAAGNQVAPPATAPSPAPAPQEAASAAPSAPPVQGLE